MKDSQSALLLALASAKRIGDLHAFSVDSDCIHFGPGNCGVTLWPRITCLKSLSTPFRTQTVSLSALSSESSTSRDANAQISVCPVRALRIYIDRSASFRQSDQLSCVLRWLCEGPYQNRGFPLDCGRYQVKSSHLYLYSAFNNTNCDKATAQYQNGKIVSIM